MTLESAINSLTRELRLTPDERAIALSILERALNSQYQEGWSAGYADALDNDEEERFS